MAGAPRGRCIFSGAFCIALMLSLMAPVSTNALFVGRTEPTCPCAFRGARRVFRSFFAQSKLASDCWHRIARLRTAATHSNRSPSAWPAPHRLLRRAQHHPALMQLWEAPRRTTARFVSRRKAAATARSECESLRRLGKLLAIETGSSAICSGRGHAIAARRASRRRRRATTTARSGSASP
jgi:hypothetical protein